MGKIFKFLLLVVVLIAAAYVAGFWPQRERVSTLQAENAALQQRVDAAEARVRAGTLLGELLALKEVVQEMNFGQARGMSSPFFDHVRAEAGRTTDAGVKQALTFIDALRDPTTIALTQGDTAALSHLREAEKRLRQALGYPPPPAAAPAPAPAQLPTPVDGTGSPTTVPAFPGASPTPPSPLPMP